MTRKDFELIARTIKNKTETAVARNHFAKVFADALQEHTGNANFDRARFLKACGYAE